MMENLRDWELCTSMESPFMFQKLVEMIPGKLLVHLTRQVFHVIMKEINKDTTLGQM